MVAVEDDLFGGHGCDAFRVVGEAEKVLGIISKLCEARDEWRPTRQWSWWNMETPYTFAVSGLLGAGSEAGRLLVYSVGTSIIPSPAGVGKS